MQRAHRHWIWLVLIAFLATRLVDVHLHLCLDGQEPPASVHVYDGSIHDDEHHADASSHADRDVEVLDAVLLKKAADPFDALIPLVFAGLLLLLLSPGGCRLLPVASPVVFRSLLLLRPPLRGPPR